MPQSLSISFTLGKASAKHEANIPHANREFIAKNIDQSKTHQNITYVRQDVEDSCVGSAVLFLSGSQQKPEFALSDRHICFVVH